MDNEVINYVCNILISQIESALKIPDVEEKINEFEEIYMDLLDWFPNELKKLRLYSVNLLSGKIDKKYLIKYSEKGYVDENFEKLRKFLQDKQNAIGEIPPAFYVKELRLKNFRLFEDLNITLKNGINILIGDNGVGKTSVLDAIAIGLKRMIDFAKFTNASFNYDDITLGGSFSSIELVVSDDIECYYSYKSKGADIEKRKKLDNLSNKYKDIYDYMRDQSFYPIISYHRIVNSETKNKYKSTPDRMQGYFGCLNGRADIQYIETWMNDDKTSADDKSKFLKLINNFMMKMLDTPLNIIYSSEKKKMCARMKDSMVKVSSLSSGFQTLLNLVIDISFRLVVLNPQIKMEGKYIGIVLIDEIDLHLHPKWQWKVLSVIEEMFPNIQFIVTTHSPLIISSCKRCNLIQINHNGNGLDEPQTMTLASTGIYGKPVSSIIEQEFGSYIVPLSEKLAYDKFEELFDAKKFDEAKNQINKMKKEFGDYNEYVLKASQRLYVRELLDSRR